MENKQYALKRFDDGYNCAQAVFSVYAETEGMDHDTALKVATAFGGGISRMGYTCGAVNGALLALGLKYGMSDPQDKSAKEQTYALSQEFSRRFKERNGAVTCPLLLGYDISTPEGHQAVKERGLFKTACPKFVSDSIQILEELTHSK